MLTLLTIFVVIEAGLLLAVAWRSNIVAAVLLGLLMLATTWFAFALYQHRLTDAAGLRLLKIAIPLIKLGAIIIAVPFLWWKKRRLQPDTVYRDTPPGPAWAQTNERFVEAGTDRVISVWFNPQTGERVYVRMSRQ